MKINPDLCSCCGEIWNRDNLKDIPLGKNQLHLCPDCYAEFKALTKTTCEDTISKQVLLNLPRKEMKNYFGEVVTEVIDIKDIIAL